jgi:hypothetical protein
MPFFLKKITKKEERRKKKKTRKTGGYGIKVVRPPPRDQMGVAETTPKPSEPPLFGQEGGSATPKGRNRGGRNQPQMARFFASFLKKKTRAF